MNTDITAEPLIIFEFPLTEAMRFCLQLEELFTATRGMSSQSNDHTIQCGLEALLRLMALTERSDLKSKLSQALAQYANRLMQLMRHHDVDVRRLQDLLDSMDFLQSALQVESVRIGEVLRQHELLSQLKSQACMPGGPVAYRIPAYVHWRAQPLSDRVAQITGWLSAFNVLRDVSEMLLSLLRDAGEFCHVTAEKGLFWQALSSVAPPQLLRIKLNARKNIYPKCSAGNHRVTIHFMQPQYTPSVQANQVSDTLAFQLACCKL